MLCMKTLRPHLVGKGYSVTRELYAWQFDRSEKWTLPSVCILLERQLRLRTDFWRWRLTQGLGGLAVDQANVDSPLILSLWATHFPSRCLSLLI